LNPGIADFSKRARIAFEDKRMSAFDCVAANGIGVSYQDSQTAQKFIPVL
jgi:hypothetical protein